LGLLGRFRDGALGGRVKRFTVAFQGLGNNNLTVVTAMGVGEVR